MLLRLLILLGLSLCVTAPARAYDICNETSYVVHIATGWPVAGGVAIEDLTNGGANVSQIRLPCVGGQR